MARLTYDDNWSINLTDEQLAAGLAARDAGGSDWDIWDALRKAGVPVRDESGRTVASLAKTCILSLGHGMATVALG